eukprot:TRINITY_DN1875_c0_g1_i1.p1 TRINITY_DN1875_c0_g1~~TRINITY_DN1875_c0_g1_i1.p1  ORF type:complete len:472 (+),score=82.27 TRINITY_DN1875_c0_g1_i1:1508-2923(+)
MSSMSPTSSDPNSDSRVVRVLLHQDHYYLILDMSYQRKKCHFCGGAFIKKHKCFSSRSKPDPISDDRAPVKSPVISDSDGEAGAPSVKSQRYSGEKIFSINSSSEGSPAQEEAKQIVSFVSEIKRSDVQSIKTAQSVTRSIDFLVRKPKEEPSREEDDDIIICSSPPVTRSKQKTEETIATEQPPLDIDRSKDKLSSVSASPSLVGRVKSESANEMSYSFDKLSKEKKNHSTGSYLTNEQKVTDSVIVTDVSRGPSAMQRHQQMMSSYGHTPSSSHYFGMSSRVSVPQSYYYSHSSLPSFSLPQNIPNQNPHQTSNFFHPFQALPSLSSLLDLTSVTGPGPMSTSYLPTNHKPFVTNTSSPISSPSPPPSSPLAQMTNRYSHFQNHTINTSLPSINQMCSSPSTVPNQYPFDSMSSRFTSSHRLQVSSTTELKVQQDPIESDLRARFGDQRHSHQQSNRGLFRTPFLRDYK